MNVFGTQHLEWARPDVDAIVQRHGLTSTTAAKHDELRGWLEQHGYEFIRVDCANGFAALLDHFNALFSWEVQFGYPLSDGRANLDALRDGFDIQFPTGVGVVLELASLDAVYLTHPQWTLGMLSVASEHSRYHLAMGRRFFTLLVLDKESPLIGAAVDQIIVPSTYWTASGKLPS